MTVNIRRKTCDDDRRHILQGKDLGLFVVAGLAYQLSVSATDRALRRIYADDVVGHGTCPEIDIERTFSPPLIMVSNAASNLQPGVVRDTFFPVSGSAV